MFSICGTAINVIVSSQHGELPLTETKWIWVLLMINLPSLLYAFLYAISWSEGCDFFLTNQPLFSCERKKILPKGLSDHDMAELRYRPA